MRAAGGQAVAPKRVRDLIRGESGVTAQAGAAAYS